MASTPEKPLPSIPMSIQGLFSLLEGLYPLSEKFKNALQREMTVLSLPKNYLLHEAPKVSDHAYYLDEGFAMSYSFYKGTKITENFWRAGEIMASLESFFEQRPSLENIQLLQKSEVFCISHNSVMHLLKMFDEARHVQQMLLGRFYAQYRIRIHERERLTARQRFEKLLKTHPNLEAIVSQHAIATYVGITAQSLARMKRNEY